jgi:hypothetical protein
MKGGGTVRCNGGFSDAVFSVVAAFLAEEGGRFVAGVQAVEL